MDCVVNYSVMPAAQVLRLRRNASSAKLANERAPRPEQASPAPEQPPSSGLVVPGEPPGPMRPARLMRPASLLRQGLVVVTGRDRERGEPALQRIRNEPGNDKVYLELGDLVYPGGASTAMTVVTTPAALPWPRRLFWPILRRVMPWTVARRGEGELRAGSGRPSHSSAAASPTSGVLRACSFVLIPRAGRADARANRAAAAAPSASAQGSRRPARRWLPPRLDGRRSVASSTAVRLRRPRADGAEDEGNARSRCGRWSLVRGAVIALGMARRAMLVAMALVGLGACGGVSARCVDARGCPDERPLPPCAGATREALSLDELYERREELEGQAVRVRGRLHRGS